MTVEGVSTSKSIFDLAQKYKIEMPICEMVYKIIYKNKDPIQIAYDEIIKKKISNVKKLEEINKNVIKEIKEAADFALQTPFPNKTDLYKDVFL